MGQDVKAEAKPERRLVLKVDVDPDLSWLEEYCDREDDPVRCDGRPITRADYIDPENHATFGAVLEERCACCGGWSIVDACWGFDFYVGPGGSWPDFDPGDAFATLAEMPEDARWIGEQMGLE